MSKKTKASAKTKAVKRAKKPAARRSTARVAAATKRTAAATIFVYTANGETRVRTSPQYLVAGPGFIEWTVVNLASGDADVPVRISWPKPGPWGNIPIDIRGHVRLPVPDTAEGHFKYNVTVGGYTEDPELEIPEV